MEVFRVTKESPLWLFKAYDYVRIDAFVIGQNISLEREFGHNEDKENAMFIVIIDEGKPVAGCNISFPLPNTARIGRVCVTRDRQKSGIGRSLIAEAEKWIKEKGFSHIAITSQDRAAAFYKKCGYTDSSIDPSVFEKGAKPLTEEEKAEKLKSTGFICVTVEKQLD